MYKVIICDKLSDEAIEIFNSNAIEVDVKLGLLEDEILAIINDYDGIAVRSATKITDKILTKAKNLKIVGRAGIGVDNIDIKSATKNGVIVMNAPFGNSITTAEHAITLILSLARKIPQAHMSTISSKWEKSKFIGTEIFGKKLGIIGCGNIGTIVAQRAQALKMKVLGYDPFLNDEKAEEIGIQKVSLDELLSKSDFITLHTPLTEKTRNIISADAINKTKKGIRIVNCARGGLIDENALKVGLESGHVAGAAIDVFKEEPAINNPLFKAPNIVVTPHLGASTKEAQEKVAIQIAEQMSDFLKTGAVSNSINMASVSSEEAPILLPYMKLGELLGSFLGQVKTENLKNFTLEFDGKASRLNTSPILSSSLAGFLNSSFDSVNMVNSVSLAESKGIDISISQHDRRCNYESLLRITIEYDNGKRTVAGTLFGGNLPRIVEVQGISFEASFPNNLLYLRNYDQPGFIGSLGSLMGDLGINIANFHLGRKSIGGEAISLIEVDQEVKEETLIAIKKLPQIVRADYLQFDL